MLLIFTGCAATGAYSENWPGKARAQLVGKCPSIAGKDTNHAILHPSEAGPFSLTQILDIDDGDRQTGIDFVVFYFAVMDGFHV